MIIKIWLIIGMLTLASFLLAELRCKLNKNIMTFVKEEISDSKDGKLVLLLQLIIGSFIPLIHIFLLFFYVYIFLTSEDKVIKILREHNK